MPSVVITGTSTGIGWGATKVLIKNGFRVFGSVRKVADAERLAAEFGENFVPLLFDVTDEAAVNSAAAQVRAELAGATLDGLVNNAGIAVAGPLLELPVERISPSDRGQSDRHRDRHQSLCAASVGTDPARNGQPGRIINISSVGGRIATPFLAPYCASKFAIEGLSESLRRELLLFGIDVIVIAPGSVATPIWDKAEAARHRAVSRYALRTALQRLRSYMLAVGKNGLPPERLGEAVLHALTVRHPKVRYTVSRQPLQDFLGQAMPKRLVDRIIGGQLGLRPAKR